MHAIGTGKIPPYYFPSRFNHFSRVMSYDICFGLRPHIPDNIPKSFKNLVERCWNTEPDLRPNIHEVHNTLLNLWTSIYHNKYSTSLNLMCLDFSAADNNKDYSDSNTQEIITKRAVSSDLETSEMIKYIEENSLVKVFSIDKLTMMTPINNDHFCKISKATLKTEKTDIIVACKRFKSTLLDKTFLHELKMQHKKLYFC
ncbi:hypothetical protein RhiirC2_744649, partial [Rhizophagus irregularis]